MKRAALLAALPAVLALGLVACGDDDDSVSTEPVSPTATTTAREGSVDLPALRPTCISTVLTGVHQDPQRRRTYV